MGHHDWVPHLLAVPDKFRGTATASEVARACAAAAQDAGWTCAAKPMSDGGEGFLEAMGGKRRTSVVHGPDGSTRVAEWAMSGGGRSATAVIEMARASGLSLVGGPEHNDAVAATTRGTGELIMAAVAQGAKKIVVGCGGSATTDGGWGAVEAITPRSRLAGIDLVVACDVATPFLDAARVFARQKGASSAQVALLSGRLRRLAQVYLDEMGVDVASMERAGAAGGLAGGLAALGASLVSGFDLVAEAADLAEGVSQADLVVTGEGYLDAQSFDGKVVGGVVDAARAAGVPVVVIVGDGDVGDWDGDIDIVRLVAEVGEERAYRDPLGAIGEVLTARLGPNPPRRLSDPHHR